MHHKAVAQVAALFRRNDLPQGHFHLLRLLDAVHKADLVAQTDAVGVGDNGRFSEHIAHDQVGALAAHAGQRQQLLKGSRHLAVVLVPQHAHAGRDIPRLGVPQSAGLDDGLDVLRLGSGQCGYAGVAGKQVLHYDIHPGVRALGRQPHADQQLPCVIVVQCAAGIRIFFFEPVDHLQRQFLFGSKIFRLLFTGGHTVASFRQKMFSLS